MDAQVTQLKKLQCGTTVKKRNREDEHGLMPFEQMPPHFPPTRVGTLVNRHMLSRVCNEALHKVMSELNHQTGYDYNLDVDDTKNLLEAIGRRVI